MSYPAQSCSFLLPNTVSVPFVAREMRDGDGDGLEIPDPRSVPSTLDPRPSLFHYLSAGSW